MPPKPVQKSLENEDIERWFAWRPVRMRDGRWIWLKWVARRRRDYFSN